MFIVISTKNGLKTLRVSYDFDLDPLSGFAAFTGEHGEQYYIPLEALEYIGD